MTPALAHLDVKRSRGLAQCPCASEGLVEGIPTLALAAPGTSWEEQAAGKQHRQRGTGAAWGSEHSASLPAQRQEEAIPATGPLLPSWCVLP